MVHEALDGARIANPMWRSENKMKWVDSKKPFRVFKADVKLISDRNPSQANSNRKMPQDPYIGFKETKARQIEDRLRFPIKSNKDDWSPDAIRKRKLKDQKDQADIKRLDTLVSMISSEYKDPLQIKET